MPDLIIIEDDETLRQMLARMLDRHGFSVREAANGLEGLKLMRELPVPLVVTDLIMPEMEGIETIRHLRRLYPDTKVVAMSGGGKVVDAANPTDTPEPKNYFCGLWLHDDTALWPRF